MTLKDTNERRLFSILNDRRNKHSMRIYSLFLIIHWESRIMIIFVVLLIILCGLPSDTKNVCRFPKNWKTYLFEFFLFYLWNHFFPFSRYDFDYQRRQNEWATTNSKTDFYKLVLSWSPSFCKQLSSPERNRSFQCQYDDFGLIV